LTVAGDTLVRQDGQTSLPGATLVRYAGGELFAAQEGGALYSVPTAGEPILLCSDELAEVTGIAAHDDLMAVASSRWIWIFRAAPPAWNAGMRPLRVENPLKAPTGLSFLGDGRLVVWTRGEDRGAYGIMDPKTGSVAPGFGGFTGPLIQVQSVGDRLLTLEKSGLVRIFALDAATPVFQVWSPGVNRLAMLSSRRLVGGRSAPEGDGSLISIDMDTGETVIVAGRNPFAYDLAYDPARKLLYSLQVDATGNTVLLANSGKDLEQQFSVMEYPGEDLNASIVLDPTDGRLYSSLGFDRVMRWDGTGLAPIAANDQVPRRLAVRAGLLYSLNRNSTVSIWDTSAGRFEGDMYFFPSGEWCVLFPDGSFAASESGARLVNVFEKKGAEALDRDRYWVKVSGQ
jgi:hypothetical protein